MHHRNLLSTPSIQKEFLRMHTTNLQWTQLCKNKRLLLYNDHFLNQASIFESHGYIVILKCTAGRKSQAILEKEKKVRDSWVHVTRGKKILKLESSSTAYRSCFRKKPCIEKFLNIEQYYWVCTGKHHIFKTIFRISLNCHIVHTII